MVLLPEGAVSATLYYTVHRYRYLAVRYLNFVLEIPSYQRHIDSGTLGLVPELRKHTQIPVTQAQQGVLGTDSLWVLSLSHHITGTVPDVQVVEYYRY